jgi:hypothetical protein
VQVCASLHLMRRVERSKERESERDRGLRTILHNSLGCRKSLLLHITVQKACVWVCACVRVRYRGVYVCVQTSQSSMCVGVGVCARAHACVRVRVFEAFLAHVLLREKACVLCV